MPSTSFEAVIGRFGVGAIAFLGMCLFVDGWEHGAFKLVDTFGQSVSWGIICVIPTIAVTYIVGVFCLEIADTVLSRFAPFRGPALQEIIAVSKTGSTVLQQRYADDLRNQELLKGAAVSFIFLALGAVTEIPNVAALPFYRVAFSAWSHRTCRHVARVVTARRSAGT